MQFGNGPWRCPARKRASRGQGDLGILGSRELGGMDCHDAATCKSYFTITGGGDQGRGVAEYVSASDTTAATCSGKGNVNCGTGASSSGSAGSNFLIYWNADVPRSTMNGTNAARDEHHRDFVMHGTKSTPTLTRICWVTGARKRYSAKRATRPCVCTQRPT